MLIFIVGYLRVGLGGVDREVAETFRLVIRAGREECGVNNTENSNQSTLTMLLPLFLCVCFFIISSREETLSSKCSKRGLL